MLTTAADIKAIERVITSQRLSTYSGSIGMRNARRTIELYAWNAQIAGAFMFPQQICEVAIRNAAGEVLEAVYGHQWPWAIGFERSLPDPKYGFSMRKELAQARGKVPAGNTNKVIPELKFAFWGKLFTKRFDRRLWEPHLRTAFQGLPQELLSNLVYDHQAAFLSD